MLLPVPKQTSENKLSPNWQYVTYQQEQLWVCAAPCVLMVIGFPSLQKRGVSHHFLSVRLSDYVAKCLRLSAAQPKLSLLKVHLYPLINVLPKILDLHLNLDIQQIFITSSLANGLIFHQIFFISAVDFSWTLLTN